MNERLEISDIQTEIFGRQVMVNHLREFIKSGNITGSLISKQEAYRRLRSNVSRLRTLGAPIPK